MPLQKPHDTVQVRDKRPAHTQNARTTFAQMRVKKTRAQTHVCAHLRTFDVRISFCYSLSQLCFAWHSSAQQKARQKAVPTDTAKKNSISTEKQTADSHVVGVQSLITDKCPTFSQIFLSWTECE